MTQAANRTAAIEALEALGIEGRNRILAHYWLSLWKGDRMPMRADFNPAKVAALLPNIGLFSIHPGVGSFCRLSGTGLSRAIGRDLTGLDWRQYTPAAERQLRLERNSAIALGQVGIGIRYATDPLGRTEKVVELQLPFADIAEDGARQILFHLDWRAPDDRPQAAAAGEVRPRVADSFHAIALV